VCDRAILLEQGRMVESGPAEDVVRAYHGRILSSAAESLVARNGEPVGESRVHEVRAVAGDGSIRDRFTEGEPVALEIWLYAEEGLEDARVTVGFRDARGEALGSQSVDGVRLRGRQLERLRLHFPGLPMREGRYFVDVALRTRDGAAELAYAERALELSVFSSDSTGGGSIRLGGTWELPTGEHTDEG